MIGLKSDATPKEMAPWRETLVRAAVLAAVGLLSVLLVAAGAAPPTSRSQDRSELLEASTSEASRKSAIRSIPFEKIEEGSRKKVFAVLSDTSVYRRMPIRVVDCDPNLYLFLVRHPDVVVNIWDVLKISELKLREVEENKFAMSESDSTSATLEFLYSDHEIQVIYGEGSYEGPLFARPVKGSCLMVLRTGYVREPDGRHYVTTRLDTFLNVQHVGAELLAKAFQPLTGKVADSNFSQTVSFVGALSRTAEVNGAGVQRLAAKLENVRPENKQRLSELASEIERKASELAASKQASTPIVFRRDQTTRRQ